MAENELPIVALLGASNLTRGMSAVVDAARERLGAPLDFQLALGNGRSYGMRSRVLFRDLPGIRDCGLWDALAQRAGRPTFALIADIGNDIMYQASNDAIAAWLRHSLAGLAEAKAQTIVVQLPLPVIRKVTKTQFELVRRMIFAGRTYDLADLQSKAEELARIVMALAQEYGASLVEQRAEWYGFDPIHFRIRLWREIWTEIVSAWPPHGAGAAKGGWRQWAYLRSRAPERRWLFGREQRSEQPSGFLDDGSLVSIY